MTSIANQPMPLGSSSSTRLSQSLSIPSAGTVTDVLQAYKQSDFKADLKAKGQKQDNKKRSRPPTNRVNDGPPTASNSTVRGVRCIAGHDDEKLDIGDGRVDILHPWCYLEPRGRQAQ